MRKRSLIMVVFLLMLYIPPSIFSSSYDRAVILTEPNMIKDFQPASADWYNSSWLYRKSVSITGAAGAGTNYQVNLTVPYDSDMQVDFDDLRFTDDDGTTLLDFWIETYTASTSALIWVEVADDLGSNQEIYMYYGNDAVSTTSSGTDTFPFFDDFEDNTLDKWETAGASWSTQSSIVKQGTYAAHGNSAGGSPNLKEDTDIDEGGFFDTSNDFMVHGWARFELAGGAGSYWCYMHDGGQYVYTGVINNGVDFSTYTTGTGWLNYDANFVTADTWYRLEIALDWTNTLFVPYIDRVAKTTHPLKDKAGGAVGPVDFLYLICENTAGRDMWIDDYYVRKWQTSEPEFDSFGDRQLMPSWNEVGSAQIIFWVALYTLHIDIMIILLGLIMIPASTIYLAYGVKHDRSSDRLFYGLIIFFLGCGLFIGGILP